ncbi:MAG: DNA-directed RNA polymerase subunit omega [Salinivirgaceae bacterium]|jgi:DNA-directed RNA polymerase subunit K/omega
MDFKKVDAPLSTETRDMSVIGDKTGNVYESINIISKRANQINAELKDELTRKLEEFASVTDNLEEIFENREQIEISKFYERLPKPALIATEEFLNDKIVYKYPDEKIQ